MKNKKLIIAFLAMNLFAISDASAGIITRMCPFDCAIARVPMHLCKDWREGDLCYVEDIRPDSPYRNEFRPPAPLRDGNPYKDFRDRPAPPPPPPAQVAPPAPPAPPPPPHHPGDVPPPPPPPHQ